MESGNSHFELQRSYLFIVNKRFVLGSRGASLLKAISRDQAFSLVDHSYRYSVLLF
jgi:hypothetical protein